MAGATGGFAPAGDPSGNRLKPALVWPQETWGRVPAQVSPERQPSPILAILGAILVCAVALVGTFLAGESVGKGTLYASVLELRIQTDSMAQQCRTFETR